MTTANGNGVDATDSVATINSQLGKRKRSPSAQLDNEVKPTKATLIGRSLEAALQAIHEHKSGEELLDYPIPSSRAKEGSASKRRRTQSANYATETIRSRIDNKSYHSVDQLLEDMQEVKRSVSSQVNGHGGSHLLSSTDVEEMFDTIQQQEQEDVVTTATDDQVDNSAASSTMDRPALQLLSLRGQTDAGVRQLFTGLPITTFDDSKDADTKRLPNGFEFINSASMKATSSGKGKDTRTFGEVFTSYRSLRPLDPPGSFRNQNNCLDFAPTLSKLGSSNKHDYRAMSLSTGSWISYAVTDLQQGGDLAKLSRVDAATNSLFKAAFSSFAPAVDHSTSVVTETDRSRKWFRQYELSVPFNEVDSNTMEQLQNSESNADIELDGDFEDLVENYVSEADIDSRDESQKVLEEIHEMIQTLSSYQSIRDLDHARGPGSSSKPTQPEVDTYGLLRTQLKILVDLLPPHAVAKLNGSALDVLNIKPSIAVTVGESTGTGQADNYTLRKQRASQAANNVSRGPLSAPGRPSYGTTASGYGTGTPTYGQSNSAAMAYNSRPAGNMYNTPRTGMASQTPQFTQQPYRAPSTAYNTPAAQSYQQTVNKYRQPYVPRATPTDYQQSNWQRPDSPQKPLINGQTPQTYQARQVPGQSPGFGGSHAHSNAAVQQRLLEQMKQPQSASSQ